MTEQINGDGAARIVITLDLQGNLTVNHPPNKIVALGMLAAAEAIIIRTAQPKPVILPVKRIVE